MLAQSERILLVVNPNSTKARTAGSVAVRKQLEHWSGQNGHSFAEVHTKCPSVPNNAEALADHIRTGDTVIGLGGDSMPAMIATGLLLAKEKKTRFATMPFGGGNDGHKSLVAPGKTIFDVLERGSEVQIHPLNAKVDYNGKTVSRVVVSYCGLGASAETSLHINNGLGYRTLRNRSSALGQWATTALDGLVTGAVLLSPPHVSFRRDGKEAERLCEISYINGASMGGTLRTGRSLTTPDILRSELSARPVTRVAQLAGILACHMYNRPMPGEIITEDSFTLQEDTLVHFDAEAVKVPAGAEFAISVNSTSVTALTLGL